ncbi:hypothetical protein HaLaN_29341, partial [Haematococcus lacustris]
MSLMLHALSDSPVILLLLPAPSHVTPCSALGPLLLCVQHRRPDDSSRVSPCQDSSPWRLQGSMLQTSNIFFRRCLDQDTEDGAALVAAAIDFQ